METLKNTICLAFLLAAFLTIGAHAQKPGTPAGHSFEVDTLFGTASCTGDPKWCDVQYAKYAAWEEKRRKSIPAPPDSAKRMKQRIADGWPVKKLNTGASAHYLSAYEKELLLEINMVRSDPQRYLPYVRREGESRPFVAACVARLTGLKPLPVLLPDSLLYVHASRNAAIIADVRVLFHPGSPFAESACEGGETPEPPRYYVLGWLVDEGNISHQRYPYGHREHLINNDSAYAALSKRESKGFCAITFQTR